MVREKIKIDIVSDLVCPWCYIGQKRLNDALQEGKYAAEISWKPFQLHPQLEKGGMEKNAFLLQKFGPQGAQLFDRVKAAAAQEGLEMVPEDIENIPNTVDVHRLMHLAKQHGKDLELAIKLFTAYFVDGKNFSKEGTLVALGESVGLDKKMTQDFLSSDKASEEVLKEEKAYREAGIQAVPTFIINDRFMIQGAQPAEVFLKAFEKIAPQQDESLQCDVDGC